MENIINNHLKNTEYIYGLRAESSISDILMCASDDEINELLESGIIDEDWESDEVVRKYSIGDTLKRSTRFELGLPTNEELCGTSAILVEKENIQKAIKSIKGYGSSIYLIRAEKDCVYNGEDRGEKLFEYAEVVEVLK